jgi:hypothetical protein
VRITIQKYWKPVFNIDHPEKTDNLFGGHLEFKDQIIFEKNLKDALPIYRSEYYYQDNIMMFKGGCYDYVCSTLIPERSTENKSIYEFFNYGEPTETGREKYFISFDISPRKKPCGFIQIDTMTVREKETRISFSVTGIETEFMREMEAQVGRENWTTDIGFYEFLHNLVGTIKVKYFNIFWQEFLNINERTGKQICASGYIYSNVPPDPTGLWYGGLNQGYYVWDALKSLMMVLGIRFQLDFTYFDGHIPSFLLSFYWRSQSSNNVGVISKFLEYEKNMIISENETKWILVIWGEILDPNNSNPSVKYYVGALFQKDFIYITDANSPNPDPNWGDQRIVWNGNYYQIAKAPYPQPGCNEIRNIKPENVLVIQPNFHAQNVIKWRGGGTGTLMPVNIAFARVVGPCGRIADEGLRTIFESTGLQEYKYLFNGIKGGRKIKFNDEGKDVNVGSEATIDGKQYICERVASYDDFTKIIVCEFREI